jgi:hypothetical protein
MLAFGRARILSPEILNQCQVRGILAHKATLWSRWPRLWMATSVMLVPSTALEARICGAAVNAIMTHVTNVHAQPQMLPHWFRQISLMVNVLSTGPTHKECGWMVLLQRCTTRSASLINILCQQVLFAL